MSYLNTKEVANLLGLTPRTIAKKVKSGKLIPVNPQHSTGYIFKKEYIDRVASKREEVTCE